MPLRSWATTEETKSPSEIKANNARGILASRCGPRAEPVDCALSKFLANVKSGWLNKRAKNDCCSRLVAEREPSAPPAPRTERPAEPQDLPTRAGAREQQRRAPSPPLRLRL